MDLLGPFFWRSKKRFHWSIWSFEFLIPNHDLVRLKVISQWFLKNQTRIFEDLRVALYKKFLLKYILNCRVKHYIFLNIMKWINDSYSCVFLKKHESGHPRPWFSFIFSLQLDENYWEQRKTLKTVKVPNLMEINLEFICIFMHSSTRK